MYNIIFLGRGIYLYDYIILVGGFNHLEKYEFVNGKDDIPYIMEVIKVMFETTNQNHIKSLLRYIKSHLTHIKSH